MRCINHYQTNLGLFCFKMGVACEYGFKRAKECFSYKRATLHNEKIKLKPITPTPPVPDYSKEVEKLYWAGVDPMTIENEELREQLITRIVLEHDANENWREYVK